MFRSGIMGEQRAASPRETNEKTKKKKTFEIILKIVLKSEKVHRSLDANVSRFFKDRPANGQTGDRQVGTRRNFAICCNWQHSG